jgi:hypothetical protein
VKVCVVLGKTFTPKHSTVPLASDAGVMHE